MAKAIPPRAEESSLVRITPVTETASLKALACCEGILTGGGVHHQPDGMWRAFERFAADPVHFFQFFHQIIAGVQPSGSIHQDDFFTPRICRLDRIIGHCAGVTAHLTRNHPDTQPVPQVCSCSTAAAR